MSSRFGPRATGTDGSDFGKRQLIAQHYKDSVTYKFRLKAVFLCHFLLLIPVGISLLEEFLDFFKIDWGPLENLETPDAEFWEWWWAGSFISILLGLSAMPKNKERLMYWSYYALFLLGLMPISVGAGNLLPDLIDYVKNPQSDGAEVTYFHGFPMVVLWFMFFVVAIQIHGFTMYFELQLIKAWKPVTSVPHRKPISSIGSSNPNVNGPLKDQSKKDE